MAKPGDSASIDGSMTSIVDEGTIGALDGDHASDRPEDGDDPGTGPEHLRRDDPLATALGALIDAIQQCTAEEQLLSDQVSRLRQAVASGASPTEALTGEPEPGTLQLLSRVLTRLMEASGTARRELARSMRAEGTSVPAIARVFGVTHQRVSNILSTAGPASTDGTTRRVPAGSDEHTGDGGTDEP